MPVALPSSLIRSAAALGTKRLASDELLHELESKRLNAGQTYGLQQAFSSNDSLGGSGLSLPAMAANLQMPPSAPSHLGIGGKHWRDGDWMCSSCNNHNFSLRSESNRCKTQRDAVVQSVSTA